MALNRTCTICGEHIDDDEWHSKRWADPVICGTHAKADAAQIMSLRELVKAAYLEGRACFWSPRDGKRNWQASDSLVELGRLSGR